MKRMYETDQEAIDREEMERAFREVMALPSGQRVLFWMLEEAGLYRAAFNGKRTEDTSYRLGEQGMGLKLLSMLDGIEPKFYPTMLLERARLREMQRALDEKAKQENDDDLEG